MDHPRAEDPEGQRLTWLKIDEAAIAAGVSTRTIIRWINTGLPAERHDGHWVIDLATLDTWRTIRATRQALRPLRGT